MAVQILTTLFTGTFIGAFSIRRSAKASAERLHDAAIGSLG
jgi:hypothetical protein